MSKVFRCPIEVECQGEPLSEADVAAWEARNGWVFPEDYRRFLLAHNGGLVRPNVFRTRSGEEAMWERPNDLSRHYESLFDAPEGFVSIGDDLGGNHTFLCLKGYRYGRIYCSDHESGCIQIPFLRLVSRIPFVWKLCYPNLSFVAPGFTAFLEGLYLTDSGYLEYLADADDLKGLEEFTGEHGFNYRDEMDDDLIYNFARSGTLEMVRHLVENGTSMRGSVGQAVLNEKEPVAILRYLLGKGADPNEKLGSDTPLALAVEKGSEDLAEILRGRGASE